MPQFKDMPQAHAAALYAYVINSGWDAHEGRTARSVSLKPR